MSNQRGIKKEMLRGRHTSKNINAKKMLAGTKIRTIETHKKKAKRGTPTV